MENGMIMKIALESYKEQLKSSLSMLDYYKEDYENLIKDLQDKYAKYSERKLDLETSIAEVDKELLKYE